VVPGSFVGDWSAGTISLLSFWDNHTGDFLGTTGGQAIFFTFQPNGEYSMFLYVLQRPLAWCNVQGWTELRGTVTFDGATFVTHPTVGRYKGSNNCAESDNFDRPATAGELAAEERTYHWAFEPNADGKTYLRIGRDPSNREYWSYFRRVE
jgi:hypothetical protein